MADTVEGLTLKGLVAMTELDIADMSEEMVKQALMDLRGLGEFPGMDKFNNEQIARLGHEEAVQMLLDLRDIARQR